MYMVYDCKVRKKRIFSHLTAKVFLDRHVKVIHADDTCVDLSMS